MHCGTIAHSGEASRFGQERFSWIKLREQCFTAALARDAHVCGTVISFRTEETTSSPSCTTAANRLRKSCVNHTVAGANIGIAQPVNGRAGSLTNGDVSVTLVASGVSVYVAIINRAIGIDPDRRIASLAI